MKEVYLEPTWKLHAGYHLRELIPFPPEGYQFIVNSGSMESLFGRISKLWFSPKLVAEMYKLAPLNLIKSYLERSQKKVPEGTELTFSSHHIVFRKEPWVIETDAAWDCIGQNAKHFKKYKRIVERAFASENCKKILCWSDFSKRMLLSSLDCSQFENKVTVLPCAVHKKEFTKKASGEKLTMLFVGSANLSGEFELRGGKEVLEAFTILSQKYRNIELIIRSDVPIGVRDKYNVCLELPNVRLIDTVIPSSELEQIYQAADIFLFPGHYDNWLCVLEAMSYELPVVATDIYAASERVIDGVTGFLIRSSECVPYYQDGLPFLAMTPRFQRAIRKIEPKMVADLVDKASLLIENETLRREMGKAGRREVEHGKFSIERRNDVLKKVFDEALN